MAFKKFTERLRKIVTTIKTLLRTRRKRKTNPVTYLSATQDRQAYRPEYWYNPARLNLYSPEWPEASGSALAIERHASVAELCTRIGGQLPLQVVKLIARGVLRALADLHCTRGVAHCDLNTSNILLSPHDMSALISQLTADSMSNRSFLRQLGSDASLETTVLLDFNSMLTSTSAPVFRLSSVDTDRDGARGLVESRSLRPPEVILGASYGPSADMWSLGCIIYDLLCGESLFDPLFQTLELDLTPEESHIIQMIELLGPFPADLVASGEFAYKWFTDAGDLKMETTYYPATLESFLTARVEEEAVASTAAFLNCVLQLRPQDRSQAQDMINHEWFTS